MGAQQSRDAEAAGDEAVKRCYYEVLGVERNASDDEYNIRFTHCTTVLTTYTPPVSRKPTDERP